VLLDIGQMREVRWYQVILSDECKFFSSDEFSRFKTVQVDAACEVDGFELDVMQASLLLTVHDRRDNLAEEVVHRQEDMRLNGDRIPNDCGGVERIGKILRKVIVVGTLFAAD